MSYAHRVSQGYLDFTQEQLKGVPQSAINGYKRLDDGKYRVTFKTPDSIPMVSACFTKLNSIEYDLDAICR